jgi:UDP-N-acetylmuramoylalanine--D-glutamate ligase
VTARALIVGFGASGRAATAHLRRIGYDVLVGNDRASPGERELVTALGARLHAQPVRGDWERLVDSVDVVVPSPGVAPSHPALREASRRGIAVRSEVELGWERLDARNHAEASRRKLVAITGTNGKTTVTSLTASILNRSGITALAAGNIGLPLVDAVDSDVSVFVAEVSSFQLTYTSGFHPDVCCMLNLTPDHLDWHGDVAAYTKAKSRIWSQQGDGDTAVLNADDATVMGAAGDAVQGVPVAVRRVLFSTSSSGDGWRLGDKGELRAPSGEVITTTHAMRRHMPHDVSNALAACAVATEAGADVAACAEVVASFEPLAHRVQLVAEAAGVRWYDDSKATTPASVIAAVSAFDSVVLIAGGRNKGLDLGALTKTLPAVRSVVAIGESASDVARAFCGRVPVRFASSMEAAVREAASVARSGDAVLLSPGCASFDWYESYEERGDDFKAWVNEIAPANGREA